ncbi:MAG: hypothetical protein CMQ05_11445 [Gammaproteobacteria bacterium]|nr:hypothetical protein [Gammaproteobacteria bacterium]RPG24637.1 MAG: metal-dependent hydrolase [Gammaproteobacteria bacterium TMED50]
MATIITHAVVGAGLSAFSSKDVPKTKLAVLLAIVAMIPDADFVGFHLGISYGDMLGHRAFTHSIAFVFLVACLIPPWFFRRSKGNWIAIGVLTFVASASHGVLDAFTNAGLGVGFLIPFDDTRYFAWSRPIETSPLSVERFFTQRGVSVFQNELLYILLPLVSAVAVWLLLRRWLNPGGT